ncbi:MAG: hypothetical protein IPF73_16910 [Betaproteobacteria bacterium]|nr:hypothetical protein [Betaproteobacteria bacterium]
MESTSLEGDVFLFPTARKLSEAELEAEVQRDLEAWNRTKGSKDAKDWITYLREHPSGRFAEIAQTRLAYFVARDEAARTPVQVAAVTSRRRQCTMSRFRSRAPRLPSPRRRSSWPNGSADSRRSSRSFPDSRPPS